MRRRDIMSTYCNVSCSDRFEFLYEYYHNYKNILSCERHCVIYMIESFMMKNHWEKYCKYYNSLNKNSLITRISECMSKGEAISYTIENIMIRITRINCPVYGFAYLRRRLTISPSFIWRSKPMAVFLSFIIQKATTKIMEIAPIIPPTIKRG